MINKALFSSEKMDWETPDDFFQKVDEEFHFDWDLAASATNTKCPNYYDLASNALEQTWEGHVYWCNPPYGLQIKHWVKKAFFSVETATLPTTIVMLLPSRTDTKHFHNYIYNKPDVEVRFLKGRLTFRGAPAPAPFPSMLVIWRSYETNNPI